MSLQQRLVGTLGEVFNVECEGADWLVLKPYGGAVHAPVRLFASESSLEQYTAKNAADGLAALGEVDDDNTGVAAALSLLSVHIEETVCASGEAVDVLSVIGPRLETSRP